MKKYCISLFLLFATLSLHAQIVGDISVTRRSLVQREGLLLLELDIHIGSNALTRSQSWTIIPELSTADRKSVKLFPHVLINGMYQQHMMERRRKLLGSYWIDRQPYMVVVASRRCEQSVCYKMEVPYEPWMAEATLVLRQIQTSPGGERRLFTVDVNGAVEVR